MQLKHALVIFVGFVAAGVWIALRDIPETGDKAPAVTFMTLDGRALSVATLQGRPVVVTFWATTCPVCIQEMPHLIELYRDLHPRGLEIIGVAMAYDPPHYVVSMARQRNIPYPIALDIQGEAAQAFGDVNLTPTTIIISPQGRIVQYTLGRLDWAKLRATLEGMLPS